MKKTGTNIQSIKNAEEKLEIKFPECIVQALLNKNGFYAEEFRFYCVLDDEDLYNTFDDIVRENTNSNSGWQKFLPKNYVAIADDGGQGCLILNKNKDNIVYYFAINTKEIFVFAQTEEILKKNLHFSNQ